MVRAGIYVRISKDATGRGLGVERQRELCSNLAQSKGWEVAQTYEDNDISAYRGAPRPAYTQMLQDMEAGVLDAVVCVDQDRLTRHPSELEDFIVLADKHGTLLANVSGDIDLSTSDGRFRARIMGAVARQESEKKSERIRRQKEQAARKGWPPGGVRRYGYTFARNEKGEPTMTVVGEEAAVIREAAQRVLAGQSLRSIAVDFNARGVHTANCKEWHSSTLRVLLAGPHLAGLRSHHGKVVGEGNWEPILDRATWEQLRLRLGDVRKPKRGRTPEHLLSGLLLCHKCGQIMQFNARADGTTRYRCSGKPYGCGGTAISAPQTEAIIIEQVVGILDAANYAPELSVSDSNAELMQLEESMVTLARHFYAEGRISEAEYWAARDALEERMMEVQSHSGKPPAPISGRTLTELWENADVGSRRAVLQELIESVTVGPGIRGRNLVSPDRLTITWR